MKEFWNERYSETMYAYGEEPNSYFKKMLDPLTPGRILLPADGEGRNGVYAARRGWTVYANDLSESGRQKALELAGKHGVKIHYEVGDFGDLLYQENSFDAVGLIYAHFPPDLRQLYHQKVDQLIKPNGHLIIEGFAKGHTRFNEANPAVGGPKDEALLFEIDQIREDFTGRDFETIQVQEISLKEGLYHVGRGLVLRAFS